MIPQYVHIGLISNKNGTKISKRTRSNILRNHLKMLIEIKGETLESLTRQFIKIGLMSPDGKFLRSK